MNDTKGRNDLESLEQFNTTPQDSNANNLLIVDANNLAFRWLKNKSYNSYGDEYIRTVESLAKSYKATNVICAFDFGRSYYRLDIHPDYKSTRKKPETEKEQQHYDEFFDCLNKLTDNLPFKTYKYRGIEGDDLIAYLAERLKQKYDTVWIVSSDRDLYQLLDVNVKIFNIFGRKEIDEDVLLIDYQLTPSQYLLSRIIEGDKSDAINGVEGIGPIRSSNLAREYKTLDNLLKALPIKGTSKYIQNLNASKELLIRNERLISLVKYNKDVIHAGKDGYDTYLELEREYGHFED